MYEFQNVRIGWEGFRMSVFPCIPSEYHSLQLADLSHFEFAMVQDIIKVAQGRIFCGTHRYLMDVESVPISVSLV